MNSELKSTDAVQHLRHALAADAFSLYCQPIGAVGSTMTYPMGELVVRLHEEEKSLRHPGAFLPVLEHYGMMPELDRWVVRHALRRLVLGCRLPRLCLNLSAQTLADRAFPAFFAEELDASGLEGECILFEIEEADAVALPDCLARFAATIGSLGSGVIIESFGRAADYWEPLKAPCVQFVKLHGSLTRRLMGGEAPGEELGALLQATAQIGIGAIADCVEELKSLRRLKALNIHYVQGFSVYPPHPMESFSEPRAVEAA